MAQTANRQLLFFDRCAGMTMEEDYSIVIYGEV
jgi:hypothetical protein